MIRHLPSARAVLVTAGAVFAAVAVTAVVAGTRTVSNKRGTPAGPASAGMIVARDPETGQYGMPTPEQIAELSAQEKLAVSHSGEGLVEVRHPDGSVSIDLQGRFQEYTVARIGADGKPRLQCGDDPASAMRALDVPAPASTSIPAPAASEER